MRFLVTLQSRLALFFQRLGIVAGRRWFLVLATVASAAFLLMWVLAVPDYAQALRYSQVRTRGSALTVPSTVQWVQYAGTISFVTGGLHMLAKKQFVWLLVVALTSVIPVALIVYFVCEWIVVLRPLREDMEGEPLFPRRRTGWPR